MELRIGLEVHVRLLSCTKLFSPARSSALNNVLGKSLYPIDVGLPGSMPVLNHYLATFCPILVSHILQTPLQPRSLFERKHYFYYDSPLGYQITQQSFPIISEHSLIQRIQLEHDTAGSGSANNDDTLTLVDYSRSGMALLEIVTLPKFKSFQEASRFLLMLQEEFTHVGLTRADLSKGDFRFDVNVSVHDFEKNIHSQRVEIKNMNSLANMDSAISIEHKRLLEQKSNEHGHETRGYDAMLNETYFLRSKDNPNDYRFLPCHDLPALVISEVQQNQLKSNFPETYLETKSRFREVFKVSENATNILLNEFRAGIFFDLVLFHFGSCDKANEIAEFIINDLFGMIDFTENRLFISESEGFVLLKYHVDDKRIRYIDEKLNFAIEPRVLASALKVFFIEESISKHGLKSLVGYIVKNHEVKDIEINKLIKELDLQLIIDEKEISDLCLDILKTMKKPKDLKLIEEFIQIEKSSDHKSEKRRLQALNFFIGKLMQRTNNRVSPKNLASIITKSLLLQAKL